MMNGINFVTNENGIRTAILIDLDMLREKQIEGRMVSDYLDMLEDIEDMIDVELSRTEESDDWETVKRRLKKEGKLKQENMINGILPSKSETLKN
jgi:hypothetical protein